MEHNFFYVKLKRITPFFAVFLELYWIENLSKTDARYGVYLFCFTVGIIATIANLDSRQEDSSHIKYAVVLMSIFAMILSICNVLAEYRLFSHVGLYDKFSNPSSSIKLITIKVIGIIVGGFFTYYNIIKYVYFRYDVHSIMPFNHELKKDFFPIDTKTFVLCFAIFFFYLLVNYPGIVTVDTQVQLNQIFYSNYSTQHALAHTLLLKILFDIGRLITGSANGGIAFYSFCQLLSMAFVFSYIVETLKKVGVRKEIVWLITIWYCIMPFNISFSIDITKDVFFTLGATIFATAMYKEFRSVNTKFDDVMLIVGGLVWGTFRSNGIISLIILITIMIAVQFWRTEKKLFIKISLIIMLCFVTNFSIKSILNAENGKFINSLNIPIQQISRVIYDGKKLSSYEIEELQKIVDLNSVKNDYNPTISDNIKSLLVEKDNLQYLDKNKVKFLEIYCSIGLKYPFEYIAAWIDQTRGYWNCGYFYWIYSNGVSDYKNVYGLYQDSKLPFIKNTVNRIIKSSYLLDNNSILLIPFSIGISTWLILGVMIMCIIKKEKLGGATLSNTNFYYNYFASCNSCMGRI